MRMSAAYVALLPTIFLVFFLALPVHAQSTNLIQNPGLETAGSNGNPSLWSKTWWGSGTPTFGYPVTGNNGTKGASLSYSQTTTGDARWTHVPVSVSAGETYAYSNWYSSTIDTEVNVQFINASGASSWGWVGSIPSTNGAWKQFNGTIKVPSGITKMVVFHLIDKPGSLVVDDFSLVKGGGTTPPQTPVVTLGASPASITSGQSSTLSWSSQNATSCTASNGWSGTKALSGSQVVSPTQNTTYTLSCTGAGGTNQASVTITVGTTPPPPPPPTTGTFSQGMVSISFDDAWLSQYQNALSIVEQAGYKGTFYLTTAPIEGGWIGFMTPAQVKDIANRGHEIAGHTVTHPDLTKVSASQLQTEIVNSKNYLQNLTGKSVTSFAYPYGAYNSTVATALKNAGYTSARGVDDWLINSPSTDKFGLKSQCIETSDTLATIYSKIDAAKANKQWYILCLHEVKGGGDQYTTSLSRLQSIVNYLKTSGMKVVTVQEGAAMMAQ